MIKKLKNKQTIKYLSLGLVLLMIFFLPKEASAGWGQIITEATFGSIFATLGLIFVSMMAAVLNLAGYVFDKTISFTLLNQGVNNIDAIKIGWRIIRDISNLFLIFALVFIAIATILQIEGYGAKKLIPPLIIVALLINFSLAITKFVIDISNILALQFYYAVEVTTAGPGTANAPNSEEYKSLSSAFMAGTQLQGVYEYDLKADSTQTEPVKTPDTNTKKTEDITNWDIGKAQWLGGFLFAIAAFVFFAGAILFIIRQVSLLILMVLSPLAFVFGIFPGTKKHGQEWWNALFSQCFFAPAYLFMFYLTAKIAKESGFLSLIGAHKSSLGQFIAEGAASGSATPGGGYLVNFLIMVALMIGALWVAKKMGAIGADMTWKWGGKINKSLSGYAGRLAARHTMGRIGEVVAKSERMKAFAARSPAIGGWFARQAQKVSKTGGLDKVRDEQVALGKTLSPQQQAKFIIRSPKAVKEGMLDKMSERQIAEMEMKASDEDRIKIDDLIASQSEAKKEKIYEAKGKRALEGTNKYTQEQFDRAKEGYDKAKAAGNETLKAGFLTEIEYIIKNMNAAQMPSFVNQIPEDERAGFVQAIEGLGKKTELRVFKVDPRFVQYGEKQAAEIKKEMNKARNEAINKGEDPTAAAKKASDDTIVALIAEEMKKNRIDMENMDVSLAKEPLVIKAMVLGLQPGNITKLAERGGDLLDAYVEQLKEIAEGNTRAQVVEALKNNNNPGASKYFSSSLIALESFGLAKEPAATAPPAEEKKNQAGFTSKDLGISTTSEEKETPAEEKIITTNISRESFREARKMARENRQENRTNRQG